MTTRREEIAAGLNRVQDRILVACQQSGRNPDEITTVVVTKTFPMSDVRHLLALGVTDLGENRDQEARDKAAQLQADPADNPPQWHFIGQLQRNKANSVARYADYVHSVDRVALAEALQRGATNAGRRLGCFVQVSLDPDAAGVIGPRGGATPSAVTSVCEAVAEAEDLSLLGLMAVAPLGEEPQSAFERLAQVRERVITDYPQALLLSAGMSYDFESAIRFGATHVRVGSVVLGERTDVR